MRFIVNFNEGEGKGRRVNMSLLSLAYGIDHVSLIDQDSFCHCKVRTKWNMKSSIQIFQIKLFVSCLKFQKFIALVYFLKTECCYMFLKAWKLEAKFNLKARIENIWNLDFHGVKMAVMHFATQFTQVSRQFEFTVENWDKTSSFCRFLRPHFQTSFP